MTTHDLKVWPQYFAALLDGTKTFEARRDDRDPPYCVGDTLRLREWDPEYFEALKSVYRRSIAEAHQKATDAAYTGRSMTCRVTYVLRGGPWLAEGYVVLGLAPIVQTHNDRHEPSPAVGAASSSVAAALIEQRIADGAPATFTTPDDPPADW